MARLTFLVYTFSLMAFVGAQMDLKGNDTSIELPYNKTIDRDMNNSSEDTFPSESQPGILKASPSEIIGQSCDGDIDCQAAHSVCSQSVCTCPEFFVASSTNTSCLKIARKIGDDCKEDVQCIAGMSSTFGHVACISFQCKCAYRYKLHEEKCIGPAVLGAACRADVDCEVRDSVCTQGICSCPKTFISRPNNNECLPIVKSFNDSCVEDSQCDILGEAECVNGTCICRPLTHFFGGNCVPIKALGESCFSDDECAVPSEPGNMRGCREEICTCIKGKRVEDICKAGSGNLSVGFSLLVVIFSIIIN